MTVVLFLAKVHAQSKQGVRVCRRRGDTSPLNSTSQVVSGAHFVTAAVRCQCSNVSWHFVLVKSIMYVAVNAGRKCARYISVNVSCLFWVWRWWCLLLRLAWFVGHTVNPSLITCDNIWMKLWVSFKPAHVDSSFPPPHLAGGAWLWQQSNTCSECLSKRSWTDPQHVWPLHG